MAVKNVTPKAGAKPAYGASIFISPKAEHSTVVLFESMLAKFHKDLRARFAPRDLFVRLHMGQQAADAAAPKVLANEVVDLHDILASIQEAQQSMLAEHLNTLTKTLSEQVLLFVTSHNATNDEPARHSDTSSAAGLALQDMRKRLAWSLKPSTVPPELANLSRAEASELLKTKWIDSGRLRSSADLSKAWGRSRQALEQATARGELFNLKSARKRYYPAAFLELDAASVAEVCLALEGLSPAAKFIFWEKPHGGLGGLTVSEYLRKPDGSLERVVTLAAAYVRDQLPEEETSASEDGDSDGRRSTRGRATKGAQVRNDKAP